MGGMTMYVIDPQKVAKVLETDPYRYSDVNELQVERNPNNDDIV